MHIVRYDAKAGGMRPNTYRVLRTEVDVVEIEVAIQTTDVARVHRGLVVRLQPNRRDLHRHRDALIMSRLTDAWHVEPATIHADLPMLSLRLLDFPEASVPT